MADTYNFTIDQGATFSRQVTWDSVNITGYTFRMYFKRSKNQAAADFQCTTGADGRIALTTPASGIFTITIDADDTAALSGQYYHDLEAESAGGVVTRLWEGVVNVSREVTV